MATKPDAPFVMHSPYGGPDAWGPFTEDAKAANEKVARDLRDTARADAREKAGLEPKDYTD